MQRRLSELREVVQTFRFAPGVLELHDRAKLEHPPHEDGLRLHVRCGAVLQPANRVDRRSIQRVEQIELRRVDAPVLVGKDVKDAIAFQLAIGPAGEVFREAGPEAERKLPEIEAALEEAINRQKIAADGIVMDSSSWVISAINPA